MIVSLTSTAPNTVEYWPLAIPVNCQSVSMSMSHHTPHSHSVTLSLSKEETCKHLTKRQLNVEKQLLLNGSATSDLTS